MTDANSDAIHWGCLERLRPDQIDLIKGQTSLAYVPWGAIEWHSFHNPVGLDGIKAHGLCVELARRTGGVVLPPVYLGTDTIKPFKGFPHTLEHPPDTVTRVMLEILLQLAAEGFRVLVLLSGHYGGGHVGAMNAARDEFVRARPDVHLWVLPDSELLEPAYPPDHAAVGETSLQLHFDPAPVRLDLLPAGRTATLDEDGVWGEDPAGATAQRGAAMVSVFVRNALPRIQQMLKESGT